MKIINPLVSIIIPVYSGSNYLEESIDSALNQTYKNIEVLVINDGSKDKRKTEKIALSYGKKIRYFYKENYGVASALNYGIKKMKGEYFSWLNHDSLYYPDKIFKQIELLKKLNKDSIIFSDFDFINENSKIIKYRKITNYIPSKFVYYLICKNIINSNSMLISKKYFEDTGLFNEKYKTGQDYEMWFRLSKKYEFIHIPESLVQTRAYEGGGNKNISNNVIKEENEVYIYIINNITNYDIEKNMDNKEDIGLFYMMSAFYLLMKADYLARAAYYSYKLFNKNIFNNTFSGFLKQIKYFLKYWSFKLNLRKMTKFIQKRIIMFKEFILNVKKIYLKRKKNYLLLVFPLYIFNKNKYCSLDRINNYLEYLKSIYSVLMLHDFISGNNKINCKKIILIAFDKKSRNDIIENSNYEILESFNIESIINPDINKLNADLIKLKNISQIKINNNINYHDLDIEINKYFYIKDIFDVHYEKKIKRNIDYFSNKYLQKYIYPLMNEVNYINKKASNDFKNVLHINTMDNVGGAAKLAYQLHLNIIKNNKKSKLLVSNKFSNDDNVEIIRRDYSNLQNRLDFLALESGYLDCFHLSTFNIKNTKEFKNADIIHLHNLHGNYFNLFALPEITRLKPCIWTLHDMFSITGHCAHSFDCKKWITECGKCPDLNIPLPIQYDRTKELWEIKKNIYSQSKLTIVCPSNWLKEKIDKSILNTHDIKLIYHGINEKIYKPIIKEKARNKLNIPLNKTVLLFNSHGGKDNYWKGGEYLNKVFEYFKKDKNIIFIIIGGNNKHFNNREINTGYIDDENLLNLYYSASDLFIYPSIAESFGLVIAESLSSGTPVIAFKTCAIPEIVTHMEEGYLADYRNINDFINGIKIFIKNKNLRKKASYNGRDKVLKKFTINRMTQQYLDLYNNMCKLRQNIK